jgi:hypothetical protein
MALEFPLELRVEIYSDDDFPAALAESISVLLSQRWPEAWDVKIPARPSLNHPAEWRAVVPVPEGATPETLHQGVEAAVLALDPHHALHLRTRWSRQESPDHQEVYEVRWGSR